MGRLKKESKESNVSVTASPTRVVAYLRISTNTQNVENQKLGLLELANRNRWTVELVEETASGTMSYKDRRLGEVIETLKAGDILLVSELSRLGRSMLEILTLLRELSERGIKVYSVKGNYELNGDSLQSRIMTVVLSLTVEIERGLLSERTKEALARKKREGVQLGRPKGPGRSKLDDKRDEIRKLYEKKVSVASIAKIYGVSWLCAKQFIQTKIAASGACS